MSGDTKRIVGESPSASRSITTRRYFVSEYTLTKSPNNFNVNRNNFDGTCETLSRRSSEDQADFIVSRLNAADAMEELLAQIRDSFGDGHPTTARIDAVLGEETKGKTQ